jgi:hypothetical protein
MSSVFGTGFGIADAAGGATVTLGCAAAAGGADITGEGAGTGLAVVTGGLLAPIGAVSGFAAAVGGFDALAALEGGAAGGLAAAGDAVA